MRGDSTKEKVDTNTKLSVFLVHGDQLYNWTMFEKTKHTKEVVKRICHIDSKIYKENESTLFFLENVKDKAGKIEKQMIKRIDIGFSFSVTSVVY